MSIETVVEVKRLARKFVQENYKCPTLSDFIITENAMMAAVIHVTEKEVQSLRKMNEASNATERELPARAGFENAV